MRLLIPRTEPRTEPRTPIGGVRGLRGRARTPQLRGSAGSAGYPLRRARTVGMGNPPALSLCLTESTVRLVMSDLRTTTSCGPSRRSVAVSLLSHRETHRLTSGNAGATYSVDRRSPVHRQASSISTSIPWDRQGSPPLPGRGVPSLAPRGGGGGGVGYPVLLDQGGDADPGC